MGKKYLQIYLTDHLAGSVMAIDILTQLENSWTGTHLSGDLIELRADIETDRGELQMLMEKLQFNETVLRKAMGWVAGKLAEMKLRMKDKSDGPLRLLESIEAVALGIDGKMALWRALDVAAEGRPELQGLDYEHLAQRAEDQRQRAEIIRLSAAKAALVTSAKNPLIGVLPKSASALQEFPVELAGEILLDRCEANAIS